MSAEHPAAYTVLEVPASELRTGDDLFGAGLLDRVFVRRAFPQEVKVAVRVRGTASIPMSRSRSGGQHEQRACVSSAPSEPCAFGSWCATRAHVVLVAARLSPEYPRTSARDLRVRPLRHSQAGDDVTAATKRPKREPRLHRPACALRANHKGECRDKDGWPARWSDPTYLGDGPYGA